MDPKRGSISILANYLIVLGVFVALAQSAPSNSTAPTVEKSTSKPPALAPTVTNSTTSGNKTSNTSDEDCEAEPEPTSTEGLKNTTKLPGGERQGKVLTPDDKDKYKHENGSAKPEPVIDAATKTNATTSSASQSGGDAAKLQGNNSTTTTTAAPSASGATTFASSSTLWTNVIFATLLSSFASSAL